MEEPFQNLIFVGLISCGKWHQQWQPWVMNGLVLLSRLIHVFSWDHFSPASLTPGLLQGQECERLRWHYGWMESSRVITLSERNTIHFKQKPLKRSHDQYIGPVSSYLWGCCKGNILGWCLTSKWVITNSLLSPAQSNYQSQANDTHIPQPGSHWPLTTSAWAASWFPSQ